MYIDVLKNNGFSHKEAKVYLAILELGEATASMIARKTKIERPTVYDVVEDLKKRDLVFVQQKKGIKHISPLSPQLLFERFKANFQKTQSILPDLLEMAYKSPIKPRTKFYDGIEGIKEVLRELSYSKEDIYLFTDYQTMPEELIGFIHDEIIPERKRNRQFAHLLVPKNDRNEKERGYDHETMREHRLVKFPLGQINPLELALFGRSTIGFMSYSKTERFAFTIDSLAIYQTLKNIFWLVWENAERKNS